MSKSFEDFILKKDDYLNKYLLYKLYIYMISILDIKFVYILLMNTFFFFHLNLPFSVGTNFQGRLK